MTRDLLEITEFNLVLSPFGSIGIDLDSLKSYFKIFKNLVLLGAKLGTWCILVMSDILNLYRVLTQYQIAWGGMFGRFGLGKM